MLRRITDQVSARLNQQLFIAFSFAGIVVFCLTASATSESIRFLGYQLPSVCILKALTGLDCPGCGLTRALILAFHGRFYDSYMLHIWGIPLAVILLLQIPYRLALFFCHREYFWSYPVSLKKGASIFVFLSLLLPWFVKISFSAYLLKF